MQEKFDELLKLFQSPLADPVKLVCPAATEPEPEPTVPFEPAAVERAPEPAPRTLAAVDPDERGTPYAEWKAAQLNELFRQHGQTGQSGRITGATVQNALEKQQRRKP